MALPESTPLDRSKPLINSALSSGNPKVVDPSPVPYVSPTIPNNRACVVRDTSAPLHKIYPAGAVAMAYGITVPAGVGSSFSKKFILVVETAVPISKG